MPFQYDHVLDFRKLERSILIFYLASFKVLPKIYIYVATTLIFLLSNVPAERVQHHGASVANHLNFNSINFIYGTQEERVLVGPEEQAP